MTRIAPLTPPYDPDTADRLARWMPRDTALEPLALFRTLAIHDELFSRMRPLGSGLLGHGRIAPRDREIVIHRACALTGAEYEWGVHAVVYGRSVGLTEEQLGATRHGEADDPAWSADDRALIELVDQLHDTCTIEDVLWARLAERFDDDQLLELLIIAGWYRLISYVVNAVGVELEPWAERFGHAGGVSSRGGSAEHDAPAAAPLGLVDRRVGGAQ